ncbi:serine/threonine protein phosphatase PrpC [Yoonia maricola]|uniref:Serine/threonine protein phosphatase PrpC n=1 Tax=Yoonia maricola TaxID=420999 RepID=A0A2M8W5P7_9RHOB|nr:protein phosphatase 2C domain-containing protein [Yoonia maricola]PJI86247.1 serine/threonine protein phosphatase PrpC [Yoonia maricola]
MLDIKEVSTNTLSFDVATVALKGARPYQEDSLVCSFPIGQNTGFAVLADGMGGHASGHTASALVVAEMFSKLKTNDQMIEDGVLNIPATLREATDAANKRVAMHTKEHDETHGMGSTLLSIVISRDKLYWVSVGDSPLLLFRDGALRQLNKDHSMAPQIDMMVKTGTMSADVGRDHPDRNTLTSAITGQEIDMIDCPSRPIALLPDDLLIVASDGLQTISNSLIAKTLQLTQDGQSNAIADALIEAIQELDHPDQDNASFVVVKLGVGRKAKSTAMDLDDLPVLATAEEAGEEQADTPAITPDEPPKEETERKAYWYRGQKYYKD